MRRYLKKILAILDGAPTPAHPQKPSLRRGQSLVEMTLVMPVLLVTFFGMVEIGWLANNFLILLDVTREGGRFGATADPTDWEPGWELNLEQMDCDEFSEPKDPAELARLSPAAQQLPVADTSHLPGIFTLSTERPISYFDGVACTVVQNMDPMPFDATEDDVVVSVFSYAVGDFSTPADGTLEVRVVGRYPGRSNECSDDAYDPFDINHSDNLDLNEDPDRFDFGIDNRRGFMLTGHHEVSDVAGCLGSEFSLAEIEAILNDVSQLELRNTPNGALLVVEMFWHHGQLLRLPFFTMIGDNFLLTIWSMFPVTAAEPTATPPP